MSILYRFRYLGCLTFRYGGHLGYYLHFWQASVHVTCRINFTVFFVTALYHILHSFVKENVVYRYTCADDSFVVCGLTDCVKAVTFRDTNFEI